MNKVTVEVRDERADVPAPELCVHRFTAAVDEGLGGAVALGFDGVVDAVGGAAWGERHRRMGQEELPDRAVEGEPVHARTSRVNQHCAGTVQDIACRHLGGPGWRKSASVSGLYKG